MIKFKDLLYEDKFEPYPGSLQLAKDFLVLMNSGNWIIPQKKGVDVYRGTTNEVVLDVKKKYTEEREPANTDPKKQKIVDKIAEAKFDYWPKRGSSRFGSTDIHIAQRYGWPHYIFPRRGSKIVSLPEDAYIGYFGSDFDIDSYYEEVNRLKENINQSLFGFVAEEINQNVADLVIAYYRTYDGNFTLLRRISRKMSLEGQYKLVSEKYDEYRRNYESGGTDIILGDVLYFLSHKMLSGLKEYFNKGKKGIHPDHDEIMIEGDILHAKKDFIDNYLKFEDGRWKIKDEVK